MCSKIFGKFKFLRKLHITKVCTFFQFLPNFYSIKEAEIEKIKYCSGQNLAIGLCKHCKVKALSRLNFSGKILLPFTLFWLSLPKRGAWSQFEGSESKIDLRYCSLTIPGHVSVQKVLNQQFPDLQL